MVDVKVSNLTKEYNVPNGSEVAVDGVDFGISDGEFLTLVGPSGCGKTTTLRCLAGLEMPTNGKIEFDGVDVTEVPANKRNLAMMFQNIALYPHMTIRENIAYPLKIMGKSKKARDEKAKEAAETMQIPDLLEKYPGELSGGQRQRAALARTVVQDPAAFLMDEPLSDLDAKLKVEIRKEIQEVHKKLNRPTVYVTHDQVEAMTMSDRIAVMNDGKIEQIGPRNEIYNHPKNIFVAKFIGNPSMNIFDGDMNKIDDKIAEVELGDKRIEFEPAPLNGYHQPEDIKLGVRPQDITITDSSGHLEAEIYLIEPIDDRALITLDTSLGEIQAMTPPTNHEEGENVQIRFDVHEFHIFDNTGSLVSKSV